jgi:membrane fusion protein, multidrug efflux system
MRAVIRRVRRLPLAAAVSLLLAPAPALRQVPTEQALVGIHDVRGRVVPRRYTTLSSEIPAKIDQMLVREGGRFKQGDILVSFDCAVQRAQLSGVKAANTAAEKNYEVLGRLKNLNQTGILEVELAAAERAKAAAKLQEIAAVVSKCDIAAPFPGRVAELKAREKQFLQPGEAIMEILDDSALEVEFLVPSRWLEKIRIGDSLQAQIEETGRTYPIQITDIGARIDSVSQTLKLVAEFTGVFPELIAGMSGRIVSAAP